MRAIRQRLGDDPELRERVRSATTASERREILVAAGLPVPSVEEMREWQSLADVAGAGSPDGPFSGLTPTY